MGYSGNRPDLLVRLLNASGFSTSADDVEKMRPGASLVRGATDG